MNPVYIRVVLYALAGFIASAGFGTFDQEAGTLTLDVDQLALAVPAALAFAGGVFAKWGKK